MVEEDYLRNAIGIVIGNLIAMTIWILLWAEREFSRVTCFIILMISSGITIVILIRYFEPEKKEGRDLNDTIPFGVATAVSLFLFLFVQDYLIEVIIFGIMMTMIVLITYAFIMRERKWIVLK